MRSRPETFSATEQPTDLTLSWDSVSVFGDTDLRTGLVLRIMAADATTFSSPIDTPPFAVGNSVPVVTGFSVGGGTARGATTVQFQASDLSEDLVQLTKLELSVVGDFSDTVDIAAAHLNGGLPSCLATSSAGVVHRFVWDSGFAPAVISQSARLRMTVVDALGDSSTPATSEPFTLDNAPVIALSV